MALPMVHLAVARALYERRKDDVMADGAYYLGAISPDAVHMRPAYDKALKAASHFTADKSRQKDPAAWTADALLALQGRKSDPFCLGYVVHVLTDIIWAQTLGGKIYDAYDADPSPAQSRSAAYYNDTDLIDIELYKNAAWRREVFGLMEEAQAQSFDELVTEADCAAWLARTIRWYDEHYESMYQPMRYVSEAETAAFIQEAAEEIEKLLDAK